MENWSVCPRCESKRVRKVSKWALPVALFASASIFIWIGIIFPFLWVCIPICLVLGVIMAVVGKSVWQCKDCKHSWPVEKIKLENKTITVDQDTSNINPQPLSENPQYADFPEIDEKGMKILRILDDVRLTGVTKEHEGVNPQDIIELLNEGEEVFFRRVPMKKYPNATLVVDCDQNPIGWIPESFSYQEDIAKRIDEGTTVKGRVCSILGGENGKSYGVRINIARYEKERAKRSK